MIGQAAPSDATVSNHNSLATVSRSRAPSDTRSSQVYLIFQIHTPLGTISFTQVQKGKRTNNTSFFFPDLEEEALKIDGVCKASSQAMLQVQSEGRCRKSLTGTQEISFKVSCGFFSCRELDEKIYTHVRLSRNPPRHLCSRSLLLTSFMFKIHSSDPRRENKYISHNVETIPAELQSCNTLTCLMSKYTAYHTIKSS